MIIKKKSKIYILIVEGMQVKKKNPLSMLQNYYRNTLDLKTGY